MARRRGPHEGSIHLRGDGRWAAVVHVGYDDRGRRRRKYFYGATRAEVAAKMAPALKAAGDGMPIPEERTSVASFLESWLREVVRPTLRPSTYRSYEGVVRVHLVPILGRRPLARMTPQDVQALLNAKSAAGLSPRTVEIIRAVLRDALNQAMRWGIVGRNVAALASAPKAHRMEVRALEPEEARTFLAAVRRDRLEALYTVALAVGLRQGEALGLGWEDVDLEAGKVAVHRALQRVDGQLMFVEPKTQQSRRTVYLPAMATASLRAHRARQLEERLLVGSEWEDFGLVFCTRWGRPLDSRNVTQRMQDLLAQAGLPRQRFHDLRHGCATLLLAQGVSPRVVMETLGHSQISLTLGTYSHVAPALQREAAARLDEVLAGE